ncbi:hypothetical protein [Mixta mediterraneensis]|nr:hypothetical protein [Mixta mediterraneensis]
MISTWVRLWPTLSGILVSLSGLAYLILGGWLAFGFICSPS